MINDNVFNFIFRKNNFLNTMKIDLWHLIFNFMTFEIVCNSYLNLKNIIWLVSIFKLKECLHIDKENHISAVIKIKDFETALKKLSFIISNFLYKEDKSVSFHLKLKNDLKIMCFHSKYHIIITHEILSSRQRWWIINLYKNNECIFIKLYK